MDKEALKRAYAFVGEARTITEEVKDKLSDNFEKKSDAFKESDPGQEMESKVADLDELTMALEACESALEEFTK